MTTSAAKPMPVVKSTPAATRRRNLATEIKAVLQDEIESGHLAPGAPLDERALAERFGVSRTPVREALQQLAVQDFVHIAPRQGIFVSRLTIPQLRAQLELLCELEAIAAKLAARRMSTAQRQRLAELTELCTDTAQGGDPHAFVAANAAFHDTVYAGSHNSHLIDNIQQIRRLVSRYRPRNFASLAKRLRAAQEHQLITRAILAADEDAAHAAMLNHAPVGNIGFAEFLSNMPSGFFEDYEAR